MSMEHLYEAAGITRQAFHQWKQPTATQLARTTAEEVRQLAQQVRKKYLPGCGAREVYKFIRKKDHLSNQLVGWGKHAFERLCLGNGLRIVPARFLARTTIRGSFIFPNLIQGMQIQDIDTIYISDLCYLFSPHGKLLGYATTLLDLYSRLLLGLHFSQTMKAKDTVIPVLRQAFAYRNTKRLPNTIFHSDAGSQYIYKPFLKLINTAKMKSSMASFCYENPHAESFNDTLKNQLLTEFDLNSFRQLKKKEKFIKHCYNCNKTHSGVNGLTPFEFEQHIQNLKPFQRTVLTIKDLS